MKRQGYLYDRICEKEVLERAFEEAARGKREKKYVRPYLENKDYYIEKLQKWLREGTLKLSANKHKTIYERSAKKTREIVVPKFFPDQVVHWAYCIVMRKMFMKGMYKWNCGSIKGRGVHYGIAQAQRIQRKPKAKHTLKTDFKKYFQSVSIMKLIQLIARKIKDKLMLWLTRLILSKEHGLPIGYYTSQWFANFYLEWLDHYIKEVLHIKYYIRYVDDLVMWDSNKRKLHSAKTKIDALMLNEAYNLIIKSNWQVYRTNTRPLDFLGYTIKGEQKRMRKGSFIALNKRVQDVKRRGYCTIHAARSILSRLGWLMRCSNGVNFYKEHIKPIISKGEMCTIVSLYDKKRNARRKAA